MCSEPGITMATKLNVVHLLSTFLTHSWEDLRCVFHPDCWKLLQQLAFSFTCHPVLILVNVCESVGLIVTELLCTCAPIASPSYTRIAGAQERSSSSLAWPKAMMSTMRSS